VPGVEPGAAQFFIDVGRGGRFSALVDPFIAVDEE
jgi:hypothetical protein